MIRATAGQIVDFLAANEHLIGTGEEPDGLCANKEDHRPHLVTEGSLAPFWCTAIQADREPFRSERRRAAQ